MEPPFGAVSKHRPKLLAAVRNWMFWVEDTAVNGLARLSDYIPDLIGWTTDPSYPVGQFTGHP